MDTPVPARGTLTFLLGQAHKRASESLQTLLAGHELTVEQWRMLCVLQAEGAVTVGRLAAQVGMKIPALSKNIDRLVSRALVHRQRDTSDNRKVLVRLSDFGLELLQSLESDIAEYDRQIARDMGRWEAERLEKLLHAYLQN